MSGMYGADVAQLRDLARTFDRNADRLDQDRMSVGNAIRISAWVGPVAVRFRAQWDSDHSRRVHEAALLLRDAAHNLRANADDQEKTSAVDGSSARGVPAGATQRETELHARAPSRTSDYLTTLHSMNQDEDGIRIQEVRGADGVVRFVVYINGTNSASNGLFGADDNVNLRLGLPDDTLDYVRQKIEEATRHRPDAEIMLVGYSQGGLVAQRLASEADSRVSSIVTFGSPSITSPNAYGGADILRLEHLGDPVPDADGELFMNRLIATGVREAQSASAGALDSTYRGGNPFQGFDGNPHTDQADYRWLADEFERSDDPRHVAVRAGMARFQGDILSDAK